MHAARTADLARNAPRVAAGVPAMAARLPKNGGRKPDRHATVWSAPCYAALMDWLLYVLIFGIAIVAATVVAVTFWPD